jgi:LysR family hydrogen peroxide-inducible transcriptional activator
MTLTQLMYIVSVEKYRHFGTAAEKSFVTQPTLSMQIHKLEDELGHKLFDRSRTPVVPTPVGEKVIAIAREMLMREKAIWDLARTVDGSITGTIRIGIVSTVAPYLLPLFLKPFMEAHADMSIIFEEGLTRDIMQGILDDRIDAGIIASPADQPGMLEKDLFLEPFVAYVPASHPLGGQSGIEVSQLNPSDMLLLDEGHCFRDQAEKLCATLRRETAPKLRFQSGDLETLKRLVDNEYGVTLLPWLSTFGANATHTDCLGRVVGFADPEPCRKIRLVYSREYLEKTLIRELEGAIRAHLPEALRIETMRRVVE